MSRLPIEQEGMTIDADHLAQEPISAEEGTVFRLLVEAMPLAIFACWEGRIQYANPAGDALLGAEEIEDVIDHDFLRFVQQRDVETVRQLLATPQRDGAWKRIHMIQCNGNQLVADVTTSDLGEGCIQLLARKATPKRLRPFSVERTAALVHAVW